MSQPRLPRPSSRRWRTLPCALLALSFTGCLETPDQPSPTEIGDDDPDLGPPVTADELAHVPDGTTGFARVQTPHGVEVLPYVAHNGHAIHEGDTDLGPISKVDARLRGGALSSTATRWSNRYVEWAFNPDLSESSARSTIRAAIAELGALTPITFHEVTYGQHTGPWVEFKWVASANYGGMSSAIGEVGCGQIHCSSELDCRTDCGQWIYLNKSDNQPKKGTVKHEMLHALGMFHEQARNDRDSFVSYMANCQTNSGQFSKQSASLDLGPYDYNSIMHYRSEAFCVKDSANDDDPYLNGCKCLPLRKNVDLDSDGKLDKIPNSNNLSNEDVNTVWRAYNEARGGNATGDQFGKTIVVGDFDGDGYDDTAVGIPGNATTGVAGSGIVTLFKGSSVGPLPWFNVSQYMMPGEDVAAGDHFGAALAAGDIDGDGFTDLVVGAPDEDLGTAIDAGKVHVFRGGPGGPRYDHSVTQVDGNGTNETGDRFGASVAVANLTASTIAELVIGAPGDRITQAFSGAQVKAGAVYVLHEDPSQLFAVPPTRLVFAFGAASDQFGATLAVGRIDGGLNDDLAVGSPGGSRVFVYEGRTPPEDQAQWSAMALYRQAVTGAAGDQFGASLLISNVSGNAWGEVVVGAPNAASGTGRVMIYKLATATLADPTPLALAQTVVPNDTQEAGDEFGASLVAFQRDSTTTQLDLIVGSPGENNDAGMITLYRGETAGVTAVSNLLQSAFVLQMSEAGDRFGASLAAGQLDGAGNGGSSDNFLTPSLRKVDLLIGAPGETIGFPNGGPTAGAVSYMTQVPNGAMLPNLTYDQETSLAQ